MNSFYSPVLLAVLLLVACGGTTTGMSRQFDDASTGSGWHGRRRVFQRWQSSHGRLRWNDDPHGGCGQLGMRLNPVLGDRDLFPPGVRLHRRNGPRTDAGACPGSSRPEGDGGVCYVPLSCPPHCAAPGGDGGVYWCTGRDGTLSGLVTGPVPIGMSRVCYGMCV